MSRRITKSLGALAALAALALGGSALAGAQSSTTTAPAAPPATAPADTTTEVAGQETNDSGAAEKPGQETNDAADAQDKNEPADAQDKNEPADKLDAAGNDVADGPESANETAGSDGPGGHADETTAAPTAAAQN